MLQKHKAPLGGRQLPLVCFSRHEKQIEDHRKGSSKETRQLEFPAEVERFPLLSLAQTSLLCTAILSSFQGCSSTTARQCPAHCCAAQNHRQHYQVLERVLWVLGLHLLQQLWSATSLGTREWLVPWLVLLGTVIVQHKGINQPIGFISKKQSLLCTWGESCRKRQRS